MEQIEMSLKAARVNAKMTQTEAAKALKISKGTLANYESYKSFPDMNRAKEIASLYGVSVNNISWKKAS